MVKQVLNAELNLIESLPFGDVSAFYRPARLFADWSRYRSVKRRCLALDRLERIGDIIRIVFDERQAKRGRCSFLRVLVTFQRRSGKRLRINADLAQDRKSVV